MNDTHDNKGQPGEPERAPSIVAPPVDATTPLAARFDALDRAHQALLEEMRARAGEQDRQRLAVERAQLGLKAAQRELLYGTVAELYRLSASMGAVYMALLNSRRWRAGDRILRGVEILLRKPKQSRSPGRLRAALDRLAGWEERFRKAREGQVSDLVFFETIFGDPNAATATPLAQIDAVAMNLYSDQQALNREWGALTQLQEEIAYYGAQIVRSWRWRIGARLGGVFTRRGPMTPSGLDLHSLGSLEASWIGLQNLLNQTLPFLQDVDAAVGVDPSETQANRVSVDRSRVRVTQFTPPNPGNPYYTLLPQQLRARGWTVQYSTERDHVLQEAQSGNFETEIVHFHQLEPFYHGRSENIAETRRKAEDFVAYLQALKQSGVRLVWTKHNPLPHHRAFADIDAYVEREAIALFGETIVLGEHARQELLEEVGEGRVTVLPHPAFRAAYGPPVAQDVARAALGLSEDRFIFGNIGQFRPYKGLEVILDAFERLLEQAPQPRPLLVLAGRADTPDYLKQLQRRSNEHILILGEEIPDEDIPRWLGAMDATVFAFHDIWMSSSVMLALSYGVPPVAPDLGCLPDYVRDDDTGFLYRHGDVQALCDRMADALSSPLLPHMGLQCDFLVRNDWSIETVATELERVYARLIDAQQD